MKYFEKEEIYFNLRDYFKNKCAFEEDEGEYPQLSFTFNTNTKNGNLIITSITNFTGRRSLHCSIGIRNQKLVEESINLNEVENPEDYEEYEYDIEEFLYLEKKYSKNSSKEIIDELENILKILGGFEGITPDDYNNICKILKRFNYKFDQIF